MALMEFGDEYTLDSDSPRERKIAMAQRAIRRAEQQIDKILSLPEEPTTDDPDGALVIWFTRYFNPNRSKQYTYAAVKAGDGLWYTTGPQSPKGYTWDQLIDWLLQDSQVTVWVAAGWEPLA